VHCGCGQGPIEYHIGNIKLYPTFLEKPVSVAFFGQFCRHFTLGGRQDGRVWGSFCDIRFWVFVPFRVVRAMQLEVSSTALCCRKVLGKSVGEKCCTEALKKSVVNKCCREVLG